jgi:hypothetical protein
LSDLAIPLQSGTPVPVLAAPSPAMLNQLVDVHALVAACPQIPIVTEHLLHGGMYARTIRRDIDSVTVGSLINKATILIVNGSCSLLVGDRRVDLTGYNVLAGLPGRKSFSWAYSPVEMTMIFATQAKTIEEAENEIFAEADQLLSRRDDSRDQVTITGQ